VAVLLVAGLAIGALPNPDLGVISPRPSPVVVSSASSSSRPSSAAETASPSLTSASTSTPNAALLKPGFGVIYWGSRQGWEPGSAAQILPEGRTTKVGELAGSYFNQFHGTVSPDGRRAIYPAQPDLNGPWAYYLLDGSKPTEQRRLLALPNENPGPVLWSTDMSAIAFTAQDAGATQGVIPKYDSIRTLDLTTGAVRELTRITDGSYYQIVGWDKAAGTLAAQILPYPPVAGKKSTYVVIGSSGTKTIPVDGPTSYAASPDARTVVGLLCAAATACSLWTWPLADYGARVDQRLPAGLSLDVIGFRPGTSDVGLTVFEESGASGRIALWSASAGLRTVYPFPAGRSPSGPWFFRADGSAVIVNFGIGEDLVIDIATGQSARLPLSASQTSYSRSTASIRLD
jgi:WD40 repeat protein